MPEFISVKVLTLRELLSGQFRFQLPWFQRAYAWDADEAGRLLTHVSEAAGKKVDAKEYLLGTLVLAQEPGDPGTALIDGQQRVMTLTILFSVLRDMETDPVRKAEIQTLIGGETNRFEPQDGCAGFCQRYVQAPGATALDCDDDPSELSDAENNILDNRDHLKEQITERGFDARTRMQLFSYLADNCYVVTHISKDAEQAWRWLQREEETQHRFNATDKAKTSLTLAMPAKDREDCGVIWDECETLLGAGDLFALLGHLRLLKRRRVSARPLESEISKEFGLNKGGLAFMERQLRPAAKRLVALREGETGGPDARKPIAGSIERASWIDDQVWVPAALLWLDVRGEGGESALFFKRLERLVWLMRLAGFDSPQKQDRVVKLLSEIEGGDRVADIKSLDTEPALRDGALKALRSESFDRKHVVRPVLRLASLALGADPGPFEQSQATVEHILPQGKKAKGAWGADFPARIGPLHAHRLGNLTLLSQPDNHAVGNRGWAEKQPVYAASEYILSRELQDLTRWSPAAVTERTERLIRILFSFWDLEM